MKQLKAIHDLFLFKDDLFWNGAEIFWNKLCTGIGQNKRLESSIHDYTSVGKYSFVEITAK